ncbi:MAG TPA: ABC transporter ATP-binding protein [Chloroflexota bacterium]|nr:ABC transporter ATP-binding protein [Chloroflexota bacterium]
MNSPAITVTDLRVRRGGQEVLPGISLSIRSDCVTGLLGPSGSGKTTLLRAIVGVQQIISGSVTVLGHDAGSPRLRTMLGYATQQPAVYRDLTIRENLAYFCRVLGAPLPDIDRVLDETDLTGHADKLTGSLSGGELSRSSLAVALLGAPKVLLLDEPTADLDPVLRSNLWDLFHRLAGTGVSLLISSHVMDEAARCDRLLLMRLGRIMVDDTPDGLRRETGVDDLEQAFLRLIQQTGES